MILDRLDKASRYVSVHKGLDAAFAFLRRADLAQLPAGRHQIAGDWVYAMVIRGQAAGKQAVKLEVHRRYVDVQYVVAGTDTMGWKALASCTVPDGEFSEEKDCGLYVDPVDSWVSVAPGEFAIFFPEDAHAPMAGDGEVHKVVVKVAV